MAIKFLFQLTDEELLTVLQKGDYNENKYYEEINESLYEIYSEGSYDQINEMFSVFGEDEIYEICEFEFSTYNRSYIEVYKLKEYCIGLNEMINNWDINSISKTDHETLKFMISTNKYDKKIIKEINDKLINYCEDLITFDWSKTIEELRFRMEEELEQAEYYNDEDYYYCSFYIDTKDESNEIQCILKTVTILDKDALNLF